MRIIGTSLLLALSLTAASGHVFAADKVKIGYLATLTGPAAALGKDMTAGATLAVEMLGGKAGGTPIELIIEDDGLDPQNGVQKTQKLIE